MNSVKKIIVFFFIMILLIMLSIGNLYAHTLEGFKQDADAGWKIHSTPYHMGDIYTSYKFSTPAVEQVYNTSLNAGKGLWGSLIIMEKVASGNMGVVHEEDLQGDAIANASSNYNTSTNHITSWLIKIDPDKFGSKEEDEKALVIAHEIGHVYGLSHISDPTHIMYPALNGQMGVTDDDKWGMRVCTEEHGEEDHSFYCIPDDGNPSMHKKKCAYCKGYYLEDCSWADGNDYICNDCNYIRPMEVYEDNGLLKINLDGQVWVVNYSEEGTEHEWSQDPPKFSELHGYATSCILPNCRGTLTWDVSQSGQYNRYFFEYNGDDCYLWTDFLGLRNVSKVYRNEISYYMVSFLAGYYMTQWYSTTWDYTGIFWNRLYEDPVNGDYIVLWRGLANEITDSLTTKGGSLYAPALKIPVYYDE